MVRTRRIRVQVAGAEGAGAREYGVIPRALLRGSTFDQRLLRSFVVGRNGLHRARAWGLRIAQTKPREARIHYHRAASLQ